MSSFLVARSLITEVPSEPEFRAQEQLSQARKDVAECARRVFDDPSITEPTPRELDHLLQFNFSNELRDKIDIYRNSYLNYTSNFSGETYASTYEALKTIDPKLVGENRYEKGASLFQRIRQTVSCLLSRAFTSSEVIQKYLGRLEVLEPSGALLFQKVEAVAQPIVQQEPSEEYFDCPDFPEGAELINGELYYDAEGFPEVEVSSAPQKRIENLQEPLTPEQEGLLKNLAGFIMSTSSDGTQEKEIIRRLLPLHLIDSIENSCVGEKLQFHVTLKKEVLGQADQVEEGGWTDMVYSQFLFAPNMTITVDINSKKIEFSKGFRMAAVVQDLLFVTKKYGYTKEDIDGLNSKLALFCLKDKAIQLETTIKALSLHKTKGIRLEVGFHTSKDIPFKSSVETEKPLQYPGWVGGKSDPKRTQTV